MPELLYLMKLGIHEINWPVHGTELFFAEAGSEKWQYHPYGHPSEILTDKLLDIGCYIILII